jgi:hypothetical protein
MTETMPARPQRKSKAAEPPTDVGYGPTVAASQQAWERWLGSLTELSREIMQFTQHRWQEDTEAWLRIASCRSPDEAMACQQRFTETALKEYFDEAGRLSQLIVGLVGCNLPASPPSSGPAAQA